MGGGFARPGEDWGVVCQVVGHVAAVPRHTAQGSPEAQRYMSAYRAYPDDEEARNIQLEVQR